MKTLTLAVIVILASFSSVYASEYHCISKDQKTEGTAIFTAGGEFVSGHVSFQGKEFNLTSYADSHNHPAGDAVVVEDWNAQGAKGFHVQCVFNNGNDLIFQMYPESYGSTKIISSVGYFEMGKPLESELVSCTYTP